MYCFFIILKTYPHGAEENETNFLPKIVFLSNIAFHSQQTGEKSKAGITEEEITFQRGRTLSSHSRLDEDLGSKASGLIKQ